MRSQSSMHTFWKTGLLVVSSLLILGCHRGEGSRQVNLVLANVHPASYPTAKGLAYFAETVAADPLLRDRIKIDLQLGGTLGNEKEVLEKLQFGGVQMACVSVAPLAEFRREVGVLTMPYLFTDNQHMWSVLEGSIGTEILASLEGSGFVGLTWYESGARSFYNRVRPVYRLEDLAGLKIRVQKSEAMRDLVEALGAAPISIGFKQVFSNLHTGAIDGAENNLPSFLSERHFEVAKYYSYDRHSMIPDLLLIAAKTWHRLSVEDQETLRRVAKASSKFQRESWEEFSRAALRKVEAAGVAVNEVEELAAFRLAAESVYDRHAGDFGDWVTRIRAAREGA
jgi:tripartite ATP-independent transporter DctP family solute receptor